jgi:hypothetical protein
MGVDDSIKAHERGLSAAEQSLIDAIAESGLTIYDSLPDHPELYISTEVLEHILDSRLDGLDLNYPLRTRARIVKEAVCNALGYPVPPSFARTQPRFPGQDFDVYVQKANNLQVWNEEVSPSRRYVLVRVDERGVVTRVRVVLGTVLAMYDRTGTLTHKYQAKSAYEVVASVLVSPTDTSRVVDLLTSPRGGYARPLTGRGPTPGSLVPIADLYRRLKSLIGATLPDPGLDQERNRGGCLHDRVCECACGDLLPDSGQFPDVPEQLIEVKLQTAPTVDLGLVSPDSEDPLPDLPQLRHCDVRYVVFYGSSNNGLVGLDHVVVATGKDFFKFFRRFEGLVRNAKLQIPLPKDFFLT